jgi:hypothetical protein
MSIDAPNILSRTHSPEPCELLSPKLLDIVPWNHGYAHTWALRWLLEQPSLVERILYAMPGFTVTGPLRVTREVRAEKPLRPSRADLTLSVEDEHGTSHHFAIETKVNDSFRPEQIESYQTLRHQAIVYAPGATGLFMRGVPSSGELRLSGADLARCLEGVPLPPIIQTYLDVVRAEASRIDAACALERGTSSTPLPPGMTDEKILRDSAWLIELKRELEDRSAAEGIEACLELRIIAHDRGIFWSGSWQELVAEHEGGIYIDIFASIRSAARTIAIKAGALTQLGRELTYDLATQAGDLGAMWQRSARRVAHKSVSIWRLDVTNYTLSDTADAAMMARTWMSSLRGSAAMADARSASQR